MCQRGDATGAMDDADHDLRRRAWARDEGGTIVRQESIERFLRVRDVPGALQRARHLRPADRAADVALSLIEELLQIDRNPELGQPGRDHVHALDACLALYAQEIDQAR